MSRAAYGLDGDPREHWDRDAACRGMPDGCDWEIATGGQLTPANLAALRLCWGQCPVRERCLAERPADARCQIYGGHIFNAQGNGRSGLLLATAGDRRQRPQIHVALDVAEQVLATRCSVATAARRARIPATTLQLALFIFRHAPDLVAQMRDGRMTVRAALEAARTRRDSRTACPTTK